MKQFIHIPKTGGTSVRTMTVGSPDWDYSSHKRKLQDENLSNVVFTIRDPLDRFLSACKHVGAARNRRKEYALVTAEQYVAKIKEEGIIQFVFEPMTHWLGTLEQFKQLEHTIEAVIELEAVNDYFSAQGFELEHRRDGAEYPIEFDETLSEESLAWLKEKYAEDYALYEYIKTRPYYVGT